MKIAVYGATGMVGSAIGAEALRRGHQLTAVSRAGTAVAGAESAAAELADLAAFRELAENNDVVVLAIPPDRTGASHEPFVASHSAIAASTVPARIFVIGGAGALEIDGVALRDQPGFPEMFKPEATTMGAVLELYRSAPSLDWTMLAPAPSIGPGDRTGSYTSGLDSPVGDSISSADFAIAVLDEIEKPRHRGQRFTVAS